MKIQKNFTYQGQQHTVFFEKKFNGFQLMLDGVPCTAAQDHSFFGVPHVEATVCLNGENLTICAYGRELYILRNDLDIETGRTLAHPTAKKNMGVRILFLLLNFPPLIYLGLFYDRILDFSAMSAEKFELAPIMLFALAMLALSVIGLRQCFYFADHPIRDKYEKTPKIVLTVILVNVINTLLLVILDKLF